MITSAEDHNAEQGKGEWHECLCSQWLTLACTCFVYLRAMLLIHHMHDSLQLAPCAPSESQQILLAVPIGAQGITPMSFMQPTACKRAGSVK